MVTILLPGHYIFIESSNHNAGDVAQIAVSQVNISAGPMCMEFWYHMNGVGQGTLSVKVNGNAKFLKSGT